MNVNELPKGGQSQNLFNNLTPETYPARIVQVIYLGLQKDTFPGNEDKAPRPRVHVTYELDAKMLDKDGNEVDDKPHWLSEEFYLSHPSNDKAKSTARFKSIDPGMKKTEGDVSRLVGLQCGVTVAEYKKKDGTLGYKIGDVTQLMRGFNAPDLINPSKTFSPTEPDMEVWEKLPDWIKEKVLGAEDYEGSALDEALNGGGKSKRASKKKQAPKEEAPKGDIEDDDVPY